MAKHSEFTEKIETDKNSISFQLIALRDRIKVRIEKIEISKHKTKETKDIQIAELTIALENVRAVINMMEKQ